MKVLERNSHEIEEPSFASSIKLGRRSEIKDALAHVKVVEFGAYAAGPCISKYLANFGASVIHVESALRPDGFRLQYPPFKDGKIGLNRSGCFAFFNVSKKGVTLNLKHAVTYGGIAVLSALDYRFANGERCLHRPLAIRSRPSIPGGLSTRLLGQRRGGSPGRES